LKKRSQQVLSNGYALPVERYTLVVEFGKGFGTSNLCNMRKFYLTYQKCDTLCSKLIWSQYRLLMRVQDELKRELNLDDFQKLEEESNF